MIEYSSRKFRLPNLKTYCRGISDFFPFAWEWGRADLRTRNHDTVLGMGWLYLNPFLYGAIYFALVSILSGAPGSFDRLAFLIVNLQLWGFLSSTIVNGVGSVAASGNPLLLLSSMPRLLLPVAQLVISLRVLLYSLVAYAPIHFVSGAPLSRLVIAPIIVIAVGLQAFGLALIFAIFNLFLRDISRLLPHLLRLAMYLSPVVWDFSRVSGGGIERLARISPMYAPLSAWQYAVSGLAMPSTSVGLLLLQALGTGVAISLLGFFVFLKFEDQLSSYG